MSVSVHVKPRQVHPVIAVLVHWLEMETSAKMCVPCYQSCCEDKLDVL